MTREEMDAVLDTAFECATGLTPDDLRETGSEVERKGWTRTAREKRRRRVIELRQQGWKQEAIAEELGICQTTVSKDLWGRQA